jgi:dynein regulatory complex protein 1
MTELKARDDFYVKELKLQSEDIDKLLERLDDKYNSYEKTLVQELIEIERSFIEERAELIASNAKELDRLLEDRRHKEIKYIEERSERIEDHNIQLENLRIHDSEEYNLIKIKLETDIQILEQQLQQASFPKLDACNISIKYGKA